MPSLRATYGLRKKQKKTPICSIILGYWHDKVDTSLIWNDFGERLCDGWRMAFGDFGIWPDLNFTIV